MTDAFIRFGHGYETGSLGRCAAFDGFDILAAPLGEFSNADRESRSWPRKDGSPGVTYASHAIKLGKMGSGLYILMHHGAGREVLTLDYGSPHAAEMEAVILALPERTQYVILYQIWDTASRARSEAQSQTRDEWARAHVEKRIKTRRSGGRRYVEIRS